MSVRHCASGKDQRGCESAPDFTVTLHGSRSGGTRNRRECQCPVDTRQQHRQNKADTKKAAKIAALDHASSVALQRRNAGCLQAFLAFSSSELNFLTFNVGLEAVTGISTEMCEDIGSLFLIDEAEALSIV